MRHGRLCVCADEGIYSGDVKVVHIVYRQIDAYTESVSAAGSFGTRMWENGPNGTDPHSVAKKPL